MARYLWYRSLFLLEDIDIIDPHYRGRPQTIDFSVAVCQAGDIHVEFIQQNCNSPSCYRDIYAAGEEGFHHVGIIAEDYKKEVARYTNMGFEIAFNGTMGPGFVMSIHQVKWAVWLKF